MKKRSIKELQVTAKVKEYYKNFANYEKRRLQQDPYHTIEFTVTTHFLEKYLPRNGLILDAGGGPGTYTIELAKRGYDVVLLDLTPELLRIAEEQIRKANVQPHMKQVTEGSITDLSRFSDETFDGVLCLGGPLNHILNVGQRAKAVAELVRVAKRDSPLFISVISRLGLIRTVMVELPEEIQDCKHHLESGDYVPQTLPRRQVKGFTAAHWFLPEELRDLCMNNGIKVLEMAALEGLSSYNRKETNRLAKDARKWRMWIEILLQTCNQPSIVGSSEHFLLVGTKK